MTRSSRRDALRRGDRRSTAAHGELHKSGRSNGLRAAVLGSDDAIVSTASLMIGVAASSASNGAILVAGVSGLVAGSMSMAVGEYVSVSSQRDAEQADIKREKRELQRQPQAEQRLTLSYRRFRQLTKSSIGLNGEVTARVILKFSDN